MALLFMDSFDHYATADLLTKWSASVAGTNVTISIVAAAGRHSSAGLRIAINSVTSGQTGYLQKALTPADVTTLVCGVAVFVSATNIIGTAGIPLLVVRDGSTSQLTVRVNPDLSLTVLRGANNGTVLGSGGVLTVGAFGYLEFKSLIHPSAGTVDLRLNGASVLSLTGQNTRSSAVSQWTSLVFGCIDGVPNTWGGGAVGNVTWDDLYVLDGSGSAPWNTFLGDVRVDPCYPTGAGATTGWTPSAGANWAAVDDTAPNGDTDYTSAASVPLTDTYVVQDSPSVGATIYGLQHCLSMKKSDAGTCTVAPVIRRGGTDYPGADLSPSTSYGYGLQVAQTDPSTSAQWTEANFNG